MAKTVRTLDSLLASRGQRRVDLLKVDVQGYELEVLKGASGVLERAEVLLLETSLVPVNMGCPSFAEVVGFMNQSAFRVFDFCSQVRRKDGVLWQTDLLFLRVGSQLSPEPKLTTENWA